MTSINVTKGLFRVWVLFALCWVVPATVIQFDDLMSTKVGYYDPRLDQNPFAKFGPEGVEGVEKNKKCKAATDFTHVLLYCQHMPSEGSIPVIMPIWPQRIFAVASIMLPPLLLLLLGYGVLWAVRGFKA